MIAAAVADGRGLAGDYVCKADCSFSDAPPSIEVEGSSAQCRSELGGVFDGKVLNDRSVSCFNRTGTLSEDGTTLVWSNGGVWQRRR